MLPCSGSSSADDHFGGAAGGVRRKSPNVDTPGFKAREVKFDSELREAARHAEDHAPAASHARRVPTAPRWSRRSKPSRIGATVTTCRSIGSC